MFRRSTYRGRTSRMWTRSFEETPTSWPLVKSWTTQSCSELRRKCSSMWETLITKLETVAAEILALHLQLNWPDSSAIAISPQTVYTPTISLLLTSCKTGTVARKESSLPKCISCELTKNSSQQLSPSSTSKDSRDSCAVKSSFRQGWCRKATEINRMAASLWVEWRCCIDRMIRCAAVLWKATMNSWRKLSSSWPPSKRKRKITSMTSKCNSKPTTVLISQYKQTVNLLICKTSGWKTTISSMAIHQKLPWLTPQSLYRLQMI